MIQSPCPIPGRHYRRGLSLLEVVLAIAIMGMAMIIIGNLVSLGSTSAGVTKWRSEAQLLCNTKMAEISAGALPLESVTTASIPEKPEWAYSVQVQSSDLTGLLLVQVSVAPVDMTAARFEPYLLTRLIPDPNYEPEQALVQ